MPALSDAMRQKLAQAEAKAARRHMRALAPVGAVGMDACGQGLISFCGNDYFGLRQHPAVVDAAILATKGFGAGAGASRLVAGNHPLYAPFQEALARFKGREACTLFGSGYLANLGVIPALVGPGDLIVADKLSHACMLDAARLSGATVLRFAHNNIAHARMLLEAHRAEHHYCLMLTESVFSMDGDRAQLPALRALADVHDAWLLVDDAHGFGFDVGAERADVVVGTLSKGLGTYGGYVCADQDVISYLETSARSLIYSTALPPGCVAGAHAALEVILDEPERAARALAHAQFFCEALGLAAAHSPIVPVILGQNARALRAAQDLEKAGFLAVAIRPPTVPEATARLRFTFSSAHTHEQVRALITAVEKMELHVHADA